MFEIRNGVYALGVTLMLSGCAGKPIGLANDRLAACPATPNCVSSDAETAGHRVAPFALAVDAERGWQRLQQALASRPDLKIVQQTPDYLHVEARSKVFRFVDDLEFHLRPAQGLVAVRSASRIGYSDFGVNRERLEALRAVLRAEGVLR